MTLLALDDRAVERGLLAASDPLATLGAAFVMGTAVALTDDAVTSGFALALELGALRAGGIPLILLARRAWPLILSATGIGLSTLLLSNGTHPAADAVSAVVRVLAVALPGLAVLLTVDPTRLADALVARARVSDKLAYGTLAALRLLPLLAVEWRTIALARRARGLDAGRNPVMALRLFTGQVFALLVAAVRRGSRLALAMEARGFEPGAPRTVARPYAAAAGDLVVAASGPLLAALAIAASAAAGTLAWVWS